MIFAWTLGAPPYLLFTSVLILVGFHYSTMVAFSLLFAILVGNMDYNYTACLVTAPFYVKLNAIVRPYGGP